MKTGISLELPAGLSSLSELVRTLNERLRRMEELLGTGPEGGDLDMGQHRVVNMADPLRTSDAVTVAYADRRYMQLRDLPQGGRAAPPTAPTSTIHPMFLFTLDDMLTVDNDIMPHVQSNEDYACVELVGLLKTAPISGSTTVRVKFDGVLLGTVTFAAGVTVVRATLSGKTLNVGQMVTVDVTAVPIASGSFPGRGLSVQLLLQR